VIVAVTRLSIYIPHSHSLKEKRAVVRKLIDRMRARFKMHIAEVGGQDTWQRTQLGFAVVGAEAQVVESIADEVVKSIESTVEGQVVAIDREVLRYGDEFEPSRSGNGHKYE
jgi:uncharacterized protein YlxP (DUF503 family)